MTAVDFPDLLERGLGRAILFLQANDDAPFRWLIADACRSDYAYQDLEEHRAAYLYDLIGASRAPHFYRHVVLDALLRSKEGDYTEQLLHLATLFARDGDAEMRTTFYTVFTQNLVVNRRLNSEAALLKLDGLDGYLRAARLLLAHPLLEEEEWQEDLLWRDACEQFGEAAVIQLGSGDATLAAYLDRVRARIEHQKRRNDAPDPPVPSYDALKELLELPHGQEGIRLIWGWAMSQDVLIRLASDMERETDPVRLSRYLRLFRYARNPAILSPLLSLTRHSDRMVVRHAVRALEAMTHPEIRARGDELLANVTSNDNVRNGLMLLVANPEPGDYRRMQEVLERAAEQGQDELHAVNFPVREYAKINPALEQVPLLLFIYNHIACGRCRASAVEVLKNFDALPDWLLREARFDASPELRDLVAE